MRVTRNPIEPIEKRRLVPLAPERAFTLFTVEMGRWWPLATHSIAGGEATGIRFECKVGGRVVELTSSGKEHVWAEVIAWDPPERLVMAWHPRLEPVASSTVEVVFDPAPDGTMITLTHRGWEEFGDQAGSQLRRQYDPGWDLVLTPFEQAADAPVDR